MSLRPSVPYGTHRTCRLFWCYQCHRAVRIICSPAPSDVLCPRCYGRFLHEVDLPRPRFVVELTPVRPFPAHHHPLFPPPTWRRYSELDRVRHLDPDDAARGHHHPSNPWIIFRRPTDERPPRPPPAPAPPRQVQQPATAVRPGDYYTGPNLNELIDEITQNDRPGQAPAPASAIDSMPTVSITEAHLRDGSQCPVCKEEFGVGEEAREMPCKHVYHSECIVPWLNMHNSCPVCRFQLPGGQNNEAGQGNSGSGSSSRDGGGGRIRRPERWNPFFLLWPSREPSHAGNYQYRRMDEHDDFTNSPGAFYAWWRSLFLL